MATDPSACADAPATRPPLRLLAVEDDEADYRLMIRGLARELDVRSERVDSEAALRAALAGAPWDAILCDYNLPGFGAAQALAAIRGAGADVAVIVVSGSIGEDRAVELIRAGANDVVSKANLARLPQAITHEMANAATRANHRAAKEALRAADDRLRLANAQLVAANRETEMLLSSLSAILIGIDAGGLIVRWNDAAAVAFGTPLAEAIGMRWDLAAVVAAPDRLACAIASARSTRAGVAVEDLRFRRADGSDGLLAVNVSPGHHADGRSADAVVILATDSTTRRLMEAQLAHGQKMESVGHLAAGVAHEINTPIQYVGDNLQFLQKSFAEIDGMLRAAPSPATPITAERLAYLLLEIPTAIGQSLEGVDHIAAIVRAMKDFSHPDSDAKQHTDLNRAIATTLAVSRNEYKYVADVVTDLDPQLPHVPCHPGIVNQALLNVIVNAAHAIADAGRGERRGRIAISTAVRDGMAEIRIADDGVGIREADKGRIFDPFFTTKAIGRGTGQGLYLAHAAIVAKHAGTIACESDRGVGTTFTIRLPLAPGDA
ncbi:MAG TPA: ATP-binding protein [Planctomycetota bacterium]|nr:ATP-binding protein [Planctomycetota bacterium]